MMDGPYEHEDVPATDPTRLRCLRALATHYRRHVINTKQYVLEYVREAGHKYGYWLGFEDWTDVLADCELYVQVAIECDKDS